jgi:[acyl-carrier-protein] S-malonyltransferase
MRPAADRLAPFIEAAPLRDPRIPVVACASAQVLTDKVSIRAELMQHMLAPVHWTACLQKLRGAGNLLLVEAGPGRILKGLALRNDRYARCLINSTVGDFEATIASAREEVLPCAS